KRGFSFRRKWRRGMNIGQRFRAQSLRLEVAPRGDWRSNANASRVGGFMTTYPARSCDVPRAVTGRRVRMRFREARLAAVSGRRHAHFSSEDAVHHFIVVETGKRRDLINGQVGLREQIHGVVDVGAPDLRSR